MAAPNAAIWRMGKNNRLQQSTDYLTDSCSYYRIIMHSTRSFPPALRFAVLRCCVARQVREQRPRPTPKQDGMFGHVGSQGLTENDTVLELSRHMEISILAFYISVFLTSKSYQWQLKYR